MTGVKITGATTTPKACCIVMETAVSAGHTFGIGYWAKVLELTDGPLPMLVLHDHQMDEGPDIVTNFKLTVVEIADAIDKMLRDPAGTDSKGWSTRLLDDDFPDGPLADAIIQVACHGKVLYA